MSEQSSESVAVVAGQAASAAVEEIQSREELNESVAATEVAAVVAEERATDAENVAQIAAETASEAIGATAAVSEQASVAQETAEVATATASAAIAESQEVREHVQTVDDKLDMILAHLTREKQAEETTPEVQEVAVNDNSQEQSQSTETSESVQSGPTRRRAGRLARRDSRRGNSQ